MRHSANDYGSLEKQNINIIAFGCLQEESDMLVLLIEIVCRHCGIRFLMCRRCYRGHVYCSSACRDEAQQLSHREAQRKYRQTEKGRKAHRENEKKRRMGRVEKTVADASILEKIFRVLKFSRGSKRKPRCSFCGAYGTIVDAFPRNHPNRRKYERPVFFRRAL